MENKEDMIREIYLRIANKDLSYGCRIKIKENTFNPNGIRELVVVFEHRVTTVYNGEDGFSCKEGTYHFNQLKEIIGHPVMIGDIMKYFSENNMGDILYIIIRIFRDLRKPIEEQSDECIKYVYNLIK